MSHKEKIYIPLRIGTLLISIFCLSNIFGQETITFTPANVRGGVVVGSTSIRYPDEMSYKGITISSTDAALNSAHDYYIFYASDTITIKSDIGKITKIVFTKSTTNSSGQSFTDWEKLNIGNFTKKENKATWTYSTGTNIVCFKASRTYVSKIEITYTPSVELLELASENNSTMLDENNGKSVSVAIDRNFIADGGWYTLCLPFDATDLTPLRGADIKQYKGMEGSTMLFEDATELKAGHPYLVKPKANVYQPVFKDVTIQNEEHRDGDEKSGFFYAGTFDKKELALDGTNLFLGQENKFYAPLAEDYVMYGLRGYFIVPAGTNSSKMSIRMDDETTAISNVGKTFASKNTIYNLNGQAINATFGKLPKGIYVQNGKKFIIK